MTAWVTLENEACRASMKVEKKDGGLVFLRGIVEYITQPHGQKELAGFGHLERLGFEYPDYMADIAEQLESHEQEKPDQFI